MSLRYTGEATMDEPALRDVERWKDKIEVRLDNRQVFFLFFGSAMVACMLFVLGVIVGKRLESRGRAEAPAVEDPLAVLDRFGAVAAPVPAEAPLTFPRALIGGGPAQTKTRLSATEKVAIERADRPAALDRTPVPAPPVAVAERPAIAKPTLTAAAPVPVLPAAPAAVPVAAAAKAPLSAPAAKAPAAAAPAPLSKKLAALPRPLASPAAAASSKPAATTKSADGGDRAKGRFLLQLSSFQERGEADAFARRFASQRAYVVATEIPGKGTWYRVRVGNYGTMQEAAAAKTNFEREHNVIAYVAGSGPAK